MTAYHPSLPLTTEAGHTTSDEALLGAIAMQDATAFAELYDRHQAKMYGLAVRITRDAALAQDVVQEACLGVWRNASRFSEDRASGRTWLLSIVHHRAIDAVRRRRPTSEMPSQDAPPSPLVVPDVWGEVSGRLDADTVRSALAVLPALQREAIELAYFGGLTQQEIAQRTNVPLGTVKSRVRLGLLALRRTLDAAVATHVTPASRSPRGGGELWASDQPSAI